MISSCQQALLPSNCRSVMRRPALTMVAVVVVLVVLLTLVLLIVPLLKRQLEGARATICADNIRRIHFGLHMYRGDNEGWWPHRQVWTQAGLIQGSEQLGEFAA